MRQRAFVCLYTVSQKSVHDILGFFSFNLSKHCPTCINVFNRNVLFKSTFLRNLEINLCMLAYFYTHHLLHYMANKTKYEHHTVSLE